MDSRFLSDLDELKQSFLTMGSLVQRNLSDAIRALSEQDSPLAQEVSRRDDQVDLLDLQIDKQCLEFVALRGPLAGDLRFVATSLKAVKDLERIGDIAKHVAKLTMKVLKEPAPGELLEIPEMATTAQKMLSLTLDAFVDRDAGQARKVIETDDILDNLLKRIFKSLVDAISTGRLQIDQGFLLLSIAKYLERAGDHSCNMAKMVVFMVQGKDIRHSSKVKETGDRRRNTGIPDAG